MKCNFQIEFVTVNSRANCGEQNIAIVSKFNCEMTTDPRYNIDSATNPKYIGTYF